MRHESYREWLEDPVSYTVRGPLVAFVIGPTNGSVSGSMRNTIRNAVGEPVWSSVWNSMRRALDET